MRTHKSSYNCSKQLLTTFTRSGQKVKRYNAQIHFFFFSCFDLIALLLTESGLRGHACVQCLASSLFLLRTFPHLEQFPEGSRFTDPVRVVPYLFFALECPSYSNWRLAYTFFPFRHCCSCESSESLHLSATSCIKLNSLALFFSSGEKVLYIEEKLL